MEEQMEREEKVIKSKKRIEWIDYARAIAIILVIVGHAIPEYNLDMENMRIIIYSMHMPIFFILSGYTFHFDENKKLKDIFIKKVKRLLIPYIGFCFLITICHFAEVLILHRESKFFAFFMSVDGIVNTLCMTIKSAYSNLWFLPCILVAECLLYLVFKYVKKDKYRAIFCVVPSIIVLALGIKQYLPALPFCFETALFSLFYLYFGYILNKRKILNIKNNCIMYISGIIFIIVSVISIYCLEMKAPSFYNLQIQNPIIFLVTSITGSVFIMTVCQKIKNQNWLQHIGKNTLYIYGLHFIAQNMIGIVVGIFPNITKLSYVFIIMSTVCNLVICFIIIFGIEQLKKIVRKGKYINGKCPNSSSI